MKYLYFLFFLFVDLLLKSMTDYGLSFLSLFLFFFSFADYSQKPIYLMNFH